MTAETIRRTSTRIGREDSACLEGSVGMAGSGISQFFVLLHAELVELHKQV